MHEYAVVDELITSLLPRLETIPGEISAVFVRKGELRILSARALENAFELLSRGSRLESARLVVENVAAVVGCDACAYEGASKYYRDEGGHVAIPVLVCPRCGGTVSIVAGRELYVDRVAIKDDAPSSGGVQ
jgi:Zn finger protein HypA/HybF involved in hydrogenase expression